MLRCSFLFSPLKSHARTVTGRLLLKFFHSDMAHLRGGFSCNKPRQWRARPVSANRGESRTRAAAAYCRWSFCGGLLKKTTAKDHRKRPPPMQNATAKDHRPCKRPPQKTTAHVKDHRPCKRPPATAKAAPRNFDQNNTAIHRPADFGGVLKHHPVH